MSFELVIFDNDGVLVDSEPLSCRILAHQLCAWGYETTAQRCFEDFQGGCFARLSEIIRARTGRHLPDDFYGNYQTELFERFPHELESVHGVREALESIPHRKCVASSASREKVELALEVTELRGFFGDDFFSAQQAGRGKPAPDVFLFAAERMGVDPSACCVIEDSRLGVEAANAAGMACFAYSARTPLMDLQPTRGAVFASMAELPRLITGLGQPA